MCHAARDNSIILLTLSVEAKATDESFSGTGL
jgi:hypothetical protein